MLGGRDADSAGQGETNHTTAVRIDLMRLQGFIAILKIRKVPPFARAKLHVEAQVFRSITSKRQRTFRSGTTALQDASRSPRAPENRQQVLECGCPLPLFPGACPHPEDRLRIPHENLSARTLPRQNNRRFEFSKRLLDPLTRLE